MKRKTLLFIALLLALSIAGAGGSQSAQSAQSWNRAGSLPAGTWSMAAEGSAVPTLYALGNWGIQRSTDNGATWAICSREARAMFPFTPLPGSSERPALFATTPGGLRVSDDGCRTWRDSPAGDIAPSGAHIRWLIPYPNNHAVLYAGLDGLGGLYRSTDRGVTWNPASTGLPSGAWVTGLAADLGTPSNVMVSLRHTVRDHPPSFVYRSTDGGLTWRSASKGLYVTPGSESWAVGLAWSGGNLFAATTGDGLYMSTDRGASWASATTPRAPARGDSAGARPQPPVRITTLAATWEGTLLLGGPDGAFVSYDGGNGWQAFGPEEAVGKPVLLWLDQNSGRVLLSSQKSLYSYTVPQGAATVPSRTPKAVPSATPTPPPPPQAPSSTPVPPTPTVTRSPTPLLPTPTVPVVDGRRPTDPAEPADPAIADYFPETKHNIKYGFRDFWKSRGALKQFGYPITEEFVEGGITVQYFERARFEYRDGQVVLGRIGSELTADRFFRPIPFFPSEDDRVYFGATGHSVSGPFLTFWRENGQEELLGYPLSESFKDDGSEYQWFERTRFEWHPYLPEGKRIVLGSLGTEILRKRGWLP